MSKAAVLYICTGGYYVFWDEFYRSYEDRFLTATEKEYFVFTDHPAGYFENKKDNVRVIFQERLGWPDDTLMRFAIFDRIADRLEGFDYIFFMNANMYCAKPVTEGEFLPEEDRLLAVLHPGFYDKDCRKFTYERNPRSAAYIPKGEGRYYACGGVNGGRADDYLKLIQELKKCVEADRSRHITAVWHDESHLNRYLLGRTDVKVLPPSYCYPQGWDLPFPKKLIVRDKQRYLDVAKVKGGRLKYIKEYILHLK